MSICFIFYQYLQIISAIPHLLQNRKTVDQFLQINPKKTSMQNLTESIQTLSNTHSQTPEQNPTQQLAELNLKFNPTNHADITQLHYLLNNILAYPNLQQAELHMQANQLGVDDLRSEVKIRNENSEVREKMELCLCCGFVRQKQKLKLTTHLDEINNIGVSTYLYFRTIKNLGILLLILTLTYSIYSIITNVKASEQYQAIIKNNETLNVKLLSTISYLIISLGSKQLNPTEQNKYYYTIQCQIGVGVILVWFAIFFVLKYVERKQEHILDRKTISASDFTIMMNNVPRDVSKEELQEKFREYQATLSGKISQEERLNIVKINVGRPFYLNQLEFDDDEQIKQMRAKHQKYIETFVNWIEQRQTSSNFSTKKQTRDRMYTEFTDLLTQQSKKQLQLYQHLTSKLQNQTKSQTTTIFITFQTSAAMKLMTSLNDTSFGSNLRTRCCWLRGNLFKFVRDGVQYKVGIERAPEPEDIYWNNLGVPLQQNIKRKLVTYTITFTILTLSFIIVYLLSKAQQTTHQNTYLSPLISLTISTINIILALVIRKISFFQKNHTKIAYQRSYAVKSICANLINTIIIPIIVNYYIKQDIYGKNGLANDIFMLGLTNSFVSPILKLIDISYIINRIKKYLISKPSNRLWVNQAMLNQTFEYLKFQVGEEYVYLVSLFLFTCFFVSLQPILSVFALSGISAMYWVQKYSLFNKMKRPIPGTNLVNAAMFQIVLIGALVFGLGNLTWSNLMPNGIPEQALLPNVVGIGIGLFVFFIPYGAILEVFFQSGVEDSLNFYQNRIILSSEYDRVNPVTSVEALKQFQEFFLKKTVMNTVQENENAKLKQFKLRNMQSSKRLSLGGKNILTNLSDLTPFFMEKYKNSLVDVEKNDDLEETQKNLREFDEEKSKREGSKNRGQALCLLSILNQNKSCFYNYNSELKEKDLQVNSNKSSLQNQKLTLTQKKQMPLSIKIP